MTIRSELIELQQQAGGLLQVEAAVEWASENTDSALYKSLEWDNDKAGHEWRCHQIRRLIAIHVVNDDGVRQMVSLTIDRGDGGYRDLDAVMAVPDLRSILLRDALSELERVQKKYEMVSELAKVWEETRQVRREATAPAEGGGAVAQCGVTKQVEQGAVSRSNTQHSAAQFGKAGQAKSSRAGHSVAQHSQA